MYGKRRFSRKSSSRRSSGSLRGRRRFALRKVGRRFVSKPRFAAVGFARDCEKKYFDKTYLSNASEWYASNTTGAQTSNGVMYTSDTWYKNNFMTTGAIPAYVSNDLTKGLVTGTDARSRIGNKIKPRYLKGAFTFTAAAIDGTTLNPQGGEQYASVIGGVNAQYLRTTFRFMIVKDMQVNSTDAHVKWTQVMDGVALQNGVHSELNVDNMGRFIVLEDKIFTVDADSPQKTLPYLISGSKIGQVRYNGPNDNALTDKGVYVIWAAYVMGFGVAGNLNSIAIPGPVGHSRLCFTDD